LRVVGNSGVPRVPGSSGRAYKGSKVFREKIISLGLLENRARVEIFRVERNRNPRRDEE
jgi:hypothetical protein